jgi:monoamine oxidase
MVLRNRALPTLLAVAALSLWACSGDRERGSGDSDEGPAKRARKVRPARDVPTTPPDRVQVVVVGGGIGGLVTARQLEKAGLSVHVLEATDVWGGRIATAFYAPGLQGEYGMQEIWVGNPLLDVARELDVPLEGEVVPAFSSIVIDGELDAFVQDTTEQYWKAIFDRAEQRALRTWLRRAEQLFETAHREGVANSEIARLKEDSFADWMEREALPPKVTEFLRLTIECELAADWTAFSALVALLEFRVFFGDVPAYHVAGGNIRLVDALVRSIRGHKTLGATVTRVMSETVDGRPRVRVTYVRNGIVQEVQADRAVIAVPFVRLHQILFDPPLSERKWQGIGTLQRGHYVVVHFHVDKAARSTWEIDGVAPFPVLTRGPLGVVYGVNEESPESQPLEVFSLLVYGAQANGFHMAPREMKIRELLAEMDRLWPGFSSHVKASHVYSYHPSAIAVWPPGRAPIDELGQAMLEPEHGVYLTGDWTWSGHSEGAVRSAMVQARKIAIELAGEDAAPPAPPPETIQRQGRAAH